MRNLTVGHPAKQIFLFSLPLLIGNLFQQFYNMADAFIVGRILGSDALAAVGCTGGLTFLIVGFATGLTSGMSIITAQRFGANNEEGVKRSFATSLLIGLVVTIFLTILGLLITKPLLVALHTPVEIMEDAYRYIIIIMGFIGTCMLFNLTSNAMRAVGDGNSPLYFLIIACILNIILDYFLILPMGMGVRGAAVATVTAQLISGLLCIVYINKKIPILRLRKEHFKFNKKDWHHHLRLGLPMGFQSSIIAIGTIVVQFALNNLGSQAVAAYTAAQKIDAFGILPLMSFGIAMATFVGQNHGANKPERIRQGIFQCSLMSVLFAILMGCIDIFWGDSLSSLFLKDNIEAIALSHQYLIINGACYSLLALLFVFRYSLQGLGYSFVPTLAGISELVMRCLSVVILARLLGYAGACASNPLAWVGSLIFLVPALVQVVRRMPKQTEIF
ncbi:MATE family efflux transporter [Anaerotignum sp.]|uniref:MATE family efflux transporter n=1 Tax=Anaerotignum sp. TaxID=2039241 RepID=UPI0028AE22B7|nr:MATE family efflux transporter [Anaerotignum sp.]